MTVIGSAAIKPPPEKPEAEASLLGSVLMKPDVYFDVIRGRIGPDAMTREPHRRVLASMERVSERGDLPTFAPVKDDLEQHGELLAIGGAQFLVGLMQRVPSVGHAETYALIVERAALLRKLVHAANEVAHVALTSGDARVALEQAQELLFVVGEANLERNTVSLADALRAYREHFDAVAEAGIELGIPTGFKTVDMLTGGLQRGNLVILAGRPGLGKTTLALNFARHAGAAGKKIAVFSLEMSERQLMQRLIAMTGEIDSTRLRRGRLDERELQAISIASSELQRMSIWVEESPRLTVTDILAKSRRLQAERGLDLVIIDYLQLIEATGDDENRAQEVARVSRGLKAIARELEVPLIALSQLSRQIERRENEPTLSDLRDSGSLEQDADIVMFLWQNGGDEKDQRLVRLKVAKHRNGPTGEIQLHFASDVSKFIDIGESTKT